MAKGGLDTNTKAQIEAWILFSPPNPGGDLSRLDNVCKPTKECWKF